jgi:hypothetical protein
LGQGLDTLHHNIKSLSVTNKVIRPSISPHARDAKGQSPDVIPVLMLRAFRRTRRVGAYKNWREMVYGGVANKVRLVPMKVGVDVDYIQHGMSVAHFEVQMVCVWMCVCVWAFCYLREMCFTGRLQTKPKRAHPIVRPFFVAFIRCRRRCHSPASLPANRHWLVHR